MVDGRLLEICIARMPSWSLSPACCWIRDNAIIFNRFFQHYLRSMSKENTSSRKCIGELSKVQPERKTNFNFWTELILNGTYLPLSKYFSRMYGVNLAPLLSFFKRKRERENVPKIKFSIWKKIRSRNTSVLNLLKIQMKRGSTEQIIKIFIENGLIALGML